MLPRLHRIFQRYVDENLHLQRSGAELAEVGGDLGHIDSIRLVRNRLIIEGWTRADRIGVRLNRTVLWCTPDLAEPGKVMRGFTLDVPFERGNLDVLSQIAGAQVVTPLSGFSDAVLRRARIRLWGSYLMALVKLAPQIWRWKVKGDLGAREVIKRRLGLVPHSDGAEMSGDVLDSAPVRPQALPFAGVTVVMPVYNAFDVMVEALNRADRYSDMPLRLILVEDCSTDPRVVPFLVSWAEAPERRNSVRLIRNATNLGFVGTANRGLAEARAFADDPVVLLNSDALLPEAWTSRLVAPLADPTVASVTPMSNDAEIFNVPVICQRATLAPGQADAMDRAARGLHPTQGLTEAPTGVGFCMAMSPRFLALVPEFDTAFGRGYGEETDWCQKTRALGGRHLGTPHLFVEHRGGESFGSDAKRKLLERNGAEVSRRYPGYDREVQTFIRNDPMTAPRLALALVWAAGRQDTPVPVYLAHSMGGGAENDLKRRIAHDIAAGGAAVVVRVGQGHRWKLELHSSLGCTQGLTNDESLIRRLIALLPRRRIVYSCGVGERDPVALPDLLLDLAGRHKDPLPGGPQTIDLLAHDFFPVSPSYTLLGRDGGFRGIPLPGTANETDPAHISERPGGRKVSLADWQAAWGRLMAVANTTVFSESSRAIFSAVYPQAAARIRVEGHELLAAIPRISASRAADGRPVIGVLGNIGQQKGAAVVQQLSRDLARDPCAGLVVIGHLDPAFRLSPPARVHGSYELRDLPGLVARYGISAWLIPSVWPETFSFTTHEALATGLPVFCFDLGAQGDAVRSAIEHGATGAVLPLAQPPAIAVNDILAVVGRHGTAQARVI
ncbi:MAG: glycosyltransferase [Rhodobacteraceae bacterium]|nr:glycosyltransferase [Paracoccaceae bacterium]